MTIELDAITLEELNNTIKKVLLAPRVESDEKEEKEPEEEL